MTELLSAKGIFKHYPAESDSVHKLQALLQILLKGQPQAKNKNTIIHPIDLRIVKGQSLGIIGENGAGKSTLLKMLANVIFPSGGSVKRKGTIAAILELSAGFDMQRTGIENIYHKCSLLGLNKKQIQFLEPKIIAFADLSEHIHKPLKQYSSGMVVRLGFAIISHFEPDLLITDEVLAVGDEAFQRKCIAWLDNYLHNGGTLLMVSHSPFQINRLCKQCIWLKEGRVFMHGESEHVTKAYTDWVDKKISATKTIPEDQTPDKQAIEASGTYRIKSYSLNQAGITIDEEVEMGKDLCVELTLYSPDQRRPTPCIGFARIDGTPVFGVTTRNAPAAGKASEDKRYWDFKFKLPKVTLLPGRYVVKVHAMDPEEISLYDSSEHEFSVIGSSAELGIVSMEHVWK